MPEHPTDKRDIETAVVIFAKPPVAGLVKTRLACDIGEPRATELYRCFLADIAQTITRWVAESDAPIRPILAGSVSEEHPGYALFKDKNFEFTAQGSGDLGARMARVSQRCFDQGARRVLIVGADSPTLNSGHFRGAIAALHAHDVVLGPSFDGGYYLIGLGQPSPEIFRGIDWSTGQVLAQTIGACRATSRLCATLEFWYDVDTFGDLIFLKTHLLDVLQSRGLATATRTAQLLGRLDAQGVFGNDTNL